MAVTYLGSKTVGAACLSIGLALPALAPALADLAGRIGALNAQITSNLAIISSPPNPVALAASLAAAAAGVVAAVPLIVAAIPTPLLSANVDLAASVATLEATRTLMQGVVDMLTAAASAGGVHVLAVDSTQGTLGGEHGAELAGRVSLPTARLQGVTLVTESPATFTALSSVLLTG